MEARVIDALIMICYALSLATVIALPAYLFAACYDLWQEQKERKRRRMIRREMNRSRRLSQHDM
ncbi:hypothetical protein [Candidatus Darwinibacter acetoxidans]